MTMMDLKMNSYYKYKNGTRLFRYLYDDCISGYIAFLSNGVSYEKDSYLSSDIKDLQEISRREYVSYVDRYLNIFHRVECAYRCEQTDGIALKDSVRGCYSISGVMDDEEVYKLSVDKLSRWHTENTIQSYLAQRCQDYDCDIVRIDFYDVYEKIIKMIKN